MGVEISARLRESEYCLKFKIIKNSDKKRLINGGERNKIHQPKWDPRGEKRRAPITGNKYPQMLLKFKKKKNRGRARNCGKRLELDGFLGIPALFRGRNPGKAAWLQPGLFWGSLGRFLANKP